MELKQTNISGKKFAKKLDHQTGGKWLSHGTKHHMDKQSQFLKHPCRISKLRMWTQYKGVLWQQIQSGVLIERPRAEISLTGMLLQLH